MILPYKEQTILKKAIVTFVYMFRIYQVKQTVCQLYLQTAQFQCKTIAAQSSLGILESGFLYQTCYSVS